MRTISIVGTGRLGGALAIALARKNYKIENLLARNKKSANTIAAFIEPKPKLLTANNLSLISSDIVLITVQDFEIEKVSAKLAKNLQHKPIVLHTSGSLSSEVLGELKRIGCSTGSLHPLVSVSDSVSGAERFASAFFCVEGDGVAIAAAEQIVSDLEGKSFTIETEYKTLYHASAVMASGHFVALFDVALETLSRCGLKKNEAQKILLPLVRSTVENLQAQTPAEALTGTFARADFQTLRKHLDALRREVAPETLELYLQLGTRSLHLAEEQGAARENIEKMREIISLAKKNLKC